MSTTENTSEDTVDADMAELRALSSRLLDAVEAADDAAFARELLAAGNVGCGITVTA
jgi:hypothetical protein